MRSTKELFLCLAATVASVNSPVFADDSNTGSAVGSSFAGEELYDEYDDQGIAESESEWMVRSGDELEAPQGDRREDAQRAVLVGLGEAALWTTVSVRWLEWIDQNFAWSVDAGVGSFPVTSIDSRYSFVTTSKGVGGRVQWWPMTSFPLSISGEGGLFQWSVKAKCSSALATDKCSDGKLDASGAALASGILFSWLAEESLVIEWTVMGFKYSKIIKSSWDGGITDASAADAKTRDSEIENKAKNSVVGAKVISFANISVGWRF